MTDILELAAKVEALDGPDREVDCQIYIAVHGDKEFGSVWPFKPETPPMLSEYVAQFRDTLAADDAIPDSFVPRYTASLDAAMTLVPEGYSWMMSVGGAAIAQVTDCTGDACAVPPDYEGKAATPALALVAAALRAKAALGGEHGG